MIPSLRLCHERCLFRLHKLVTRSHSNLSHSDERIRSVGLKLFFGMVGGSASFIICSTIFLDYKQKQLKEQELQKQALQIQRFEEEHRQMIEFYKANNGD